MYAAHPDGVVSVKFKAEEPARTCLLRMHGRFFGGRRLAAAMWDGYTNYNVRNRGRYSSASGGEGGIV